MRDALACVLFRQRTEPCPVPVTNAVRDRCPQPLLREAWPGHTILVGVWHLLTYQYDWLPFGLYLG